MYHLFVPRVSARAAAVARSAALVGALGRLVLTKQKKKGELRRFCIKCVKKFPQ